MLDHLFPLGRTVITANLQHQLQEMVDQLYVKQVRLPEGILQPGQLTDQQMLELLASTSPRPRV